MSSKSKKGKTFSGSVLKPDPPVIPYLHHCGGGLRGKRGLREWRGWDFLSSFPPFGLYREKQRDYKSSQRDQVFTVPGGTKSKETMG